MTRLTSGLIIAPDKVSPKHPNDPDAHTSNRIDDIVKGIGAIDHTELHKAKRDTRQPRKKAYLQGKEFPQADYKKRRK